MESMYQAAQGEKDEEERSECWLPNLRLCYPVIYLFILLYLFKLDIEFMCMVTT